MSESKIPEKVENKVSKEATYKKVAFLRDKKYNPDVINALLKDDKEYSVAEVEKMLKSFYGKKEVK